MVANEGHFPANEDDFAANEDDFAANEDDFAANEDILVGNEDVFLSNEDHFVFKTDMARRRENVVFPPKPLILTKSGQIGTVGVGTSQNDETASHNHPFGMGRAGSPLPVAG